MVQAKSIPTQNFPDRSWFGRRLSMLYKHAKICNIMQRALHILDDQTAVKQSSQILPSVFFLFADSTCIAPMFIATQDGYYTFHHRKKKLLNWIHAF